MFNKAKLQLPLSWYKDLWLCWPRLVSQHSNKSLSRRYTLLPLESW